MRKVFILFVMLVFFGCLTASPALASPGLSVGLGAGKGLNPEVLPGETYSQTLFVRLGETDVATDVLIEVLGYGVNSDGGIQPLPPEEDKSSYSATSFIKPGKITLHVEPGETKTADVTVTIPSNVGDDGRYAILRFSTAPVSGGGGVGIIQAIVLPVRFTILGGPLIHTGKITDVSAGQAKSGQPIDIFTSFLNTGNHDFKINGEIEIRDNNGKLIDTLYINTSSSIPETTKRIKTTFVPKEELSPGTYSVNARLMLEDGTLLGEANGSFKIEEPYVPPPPEASTTLNPSSTPVSTPASTNQQTPGSYVLKTDDSRISISFAEGSIATQTQVAIRSYPLAQVPSPPPDYQLAVTCFRVDGLTGLLLAKDATLKVQYTAADLEKAGGNAAKLKLARWEESTGEWTILKTSLDKNTMTLTTATNRFSIWSVMVEEKPFGVNLPIIIGAIAGVIAICLITFYIIRRKRST